jgi:hypothetical protein
MSSALQERATALAAGGTFIGGPAKDFEAVGRLQLVTLLREGLRPDSRVLDVGCGCLRGGYWLIHFLDPGCYCCIEPDRELARLGREHILEPGLAQTKRPRWDGNDSWDFSVWREPFDFVLARSVWTHASKRQIGAMLDSFKDTAAPGAKFLASYYPAGLLTRPGAIVAGDYQGDEWRGRSHEGGAPEVVSHSRRSIQRLCRERGLEATELRRGVLNGQRWLRIEAVVA